MQRNITTTIAVTMATALVITIIMTTGILEKAYGVWFG